MYMKKLLFIAAAAMMLVGCGQKGYTINGDVKGLEGNVSLMRGNETIAEVQVVDDKFTFTGETETPEVLYLNNGPRRIAMIFVEKGANIDITGSMDDRTIEITGTVAHERMNEYNKKQVSIRERFQAADEEGRAVIMEENKAMTEAAFEENKGNLFGVYMLRSTHHSMDPNELLKKLDSFSPEMQRTEMVGDMRTIAEAKIRTEPGNPYIEINMPDQHGNDLALSSVVGPGKYVLVDFWASWCGPCMRELPYLLEAYEKYHDKGFEIYGVSLDRDREKWIECIEDKKMDWLHVSLVQFWDCPAAKEYGVNSIPSCFLVGPDGIIIAKNLRGEAVVEKLAELLD